MAAVTICSDFEAPQNTLGHDYTLWKQLRVGEQKITNKNKYPSSQSSSEVSRKAEHKGLVMSLLTNHILQFKHPTLVTDPETNTQLNS